MQKGGIILVIAFLCTSMLFTQGNITDYTEGVPTQESISLDQDSSPLNDSYIPINATTIGEISEANVWFGYRINSSDDKLYRIEFRSLNSQTYTLINYYGLKLTIRDKTLIGDTPLISIFNGSKLKYLAIKGPTGLFNLTLTELTNLTGLVIDQPIPITGNNDTYFTEHMLFWMYFSYTANKTGDYYLNVNRGINRLYVQVYNSTGFLFLLAFPDSIIQLVAGQTYILGLWIINYEPVSINIKYRPENPFNTYISNQVEVGDIYSWEVDFRINGNEYIESTEILSDIDNLSLRIFNVPTSIKHPDKYTGFDIFADKERITELRSSIFNISEAMFILPTVYEFDNHTVMLLEEAISRNYVDFLPYYRGQITLLGDEILISEEGHFNMKYNAVTGILSDFWVNKTIGGDEYTLELNMVQFSSSTQTESTDMEDGSTTDDQPLFSLPFPIVPFYFIIPVLAIIRKRIRSVSN